MFLFIVVVILPIKIFKLFFCLDIISNIILVKGPLINFPLANVVSAKKSYMNYKNVLLENKLIDVFKFLIGLNQSKKQKLSSKEKQALKNPKIQKLLKSF